MKLYLLDKENGNKIYAAAKSAAANTEAWWESNIATSDEQINPNAFRVTVNSHKGYGVYRSNHTFYVVAKEGDTFESVGEIFDISPKMLRKFNDVPKDGKLAKGDIVYIERKKTQWLGNVMQHKVVRDENLYSLSQAYGIRLKSLKKLNRMREGEDVKRGDIIRLK
jgi:LysM repeat protein